jgi:hypothetical protein
MARYPTRHVEEKPADFSDYQKAKHLAIGKHVVSYTMSKVGSNIKVFGCQDIYVFVISSYPGDKMSGIEILLSKLFQNFIDSANNVKKAIKQTFIDVDSCNYLLNDVAVSVCLVVVTPTLVAVANIGTCGASVERTDSRDLDFPCKVFSSFKNPEDYRRIMSEGSVRPEDVKQAFVDSDRGYLTRCFGLNKHVSGYTGSKIFSAKPHVVIYDIRQVNS